MRPLPLTIATGLAALLVFHRATVLSGFDAVLGDLGDARFNLVILEHWWLVAQGKEAWASPGFFYPVPGVLGYSDALILLAPPYALARWLGAAPLHALQATLITASTVGYAGMALLVRRGLGLALAPTLATAVAFACGSVVAQSLGAGHVQMMASMVLPWLAWLILTWVRHCSDQQTWTRTLAGCGAAVLLAAMLLTSFYAGWFTAFYLLILACVVLAQAVFRLGFGSVLAAVRGWLAAGRGHVAAVALSFAAGVTPFVVLYLPALKQSGGRPWAEVARTLPLAADLLNPQANALWAPVVETLVPWLVGRKDELGKGLTWGLLVVFLATVVWAWCTAQDRSGRATDGASGQFGPGGCQPVDLVRPLGWTVLLCWLLIMRFGDDTTLWYGVYRWFPGGLGVRSVFRFNLILALPVAVVAGIGLDAVRRRSGGGKADLAWVSKPRCAAAFLCLLVAAEQVNVTPKTLSRSQDFAMIEMVPAPPAACASFVLMPAEPAPLRYRRWSRQLDAVLVAQAVGVPTVNGYSGNAPPGWGLYDPTAGEAYRQAVSHWADALGLRSGLCGLDVDRARWLLPPLELGTGSREQ